MIDDQEEQRRLNILDLMAREALGKSVLASLSRKGSIVSHLVDRAREEMISSIATLILAPLDSKEAIQAQQAARRYYDLCTWMNEAIESGVTANAIIEDDDDPEVMKLMEQIHGRSPSYSD